MQGKGFQAGERERLTSVHIYRANQKSLEGSKLVSSCGSLVHPMSLGSCLAMHTAPCMWRPWLWRTATLHETEFSKTLVTCSWEGIVCDQSSYPNGPWNINPNSGFCLLRLQTSSGLSRPKGISPYTEGKCHTEKNKKKLDNLIRCTVFYTIFSLLFTNRDT